MRTLLTSFGFAGFFGLAGLALTTGCSPYDPDLGSRPFLCGPSDNQCPDGYQAVQSGGGCVCTAPSGGGGGGCEDQFEPNELTTTATSTPVGNGAGSVVFEDLAICPATDVDTFAFRTIANNTGAVATATFDPAAGSIAINIIGPTGSPVATGTTSGGSARVTANLPSAGNYFVQVVGAGGSGAPYSLQIQLTN